MWKNGGGGAGPEKGSSSAGSEKECGEIQKAVKTCVIDLYVSKMVALILRNENSAKHIEF